MERVFETRFLLHAYIRTTSVFFFLCVCACVLLFVGLFPRLSLQMERRLPQ